MVDQIKSKSLEYALVLAEVRDRVSAAAQLRVSPSVLMAEISLLEDQLEMRVFSLTDNEITVTEAGRVFLRLYGAVLRRQA